MSPPRLEFTLDYEFVVNRVEPLLPPLHHDHDHDHDHDATLGSGNEGGGSKRVRWVRRLAVVLLYRNASDVFASTIFNETVVLRRPRPVPKSRWGEWARFLRDWAKGILRRLRRSIGGGDGDDDGVDEEEEDHWPEFPLPPAKHAGKKGEEREGGLVLMAGLALTAALLYAAVEAFGDGESDDEDEEDGEVNQNQATDRGRGGLGGAGASGSGSGEPARRQAGGGGVASTIIGGKGQRHHQRGAVRRRVGREGGGGIE